MLQLMQLTDIGDTSCEQLGTRDEQSSMLYQLYATDIGWVGDWAREGRIRKGWIASLSRLVANPSQQANNHNL